MGDLLVIPGAFVNFGWGLHHLFYSRHLTPQFCQDFPSWKNLTGCSCCGQNSHLLPVLEDGHQPRGLYTNHKDSVWKGGMTIPNFRSCPEMLLTVHGLNIHKGGLGAPCHSIENDRFPGPTSKIMWKMARHYFEAFFWRGMTLNS